MHGINSNKNNSRIAKNGITGLTRGCTNFPRGKNTADGKRTLRPVCGFRSANKTLEPPFFATSPLFEKCIIRARHTAPLLYIPNFGLRSHPTSGFGFATSRTDGRNLFLGHHHHNTIAGCDDVPAPQRQKQLFWRALPGCYCTKPIPEQHKKNHHSGRKRVNFNVNLGVDAFLCGVRCESRRGRGRATPPAERCLCHC